MLSFDVNHFVIGVILVINIDEIKDTIIKGMTFRLLRNNPILKPSV